MANRKYTSNRNLKLRRIRLNPQPAFVFAGLNQPHEGTGRYDLQGERFGRLVVIFLLPKRAPGSGAKRWLCRCDCGNLKAVVAANLRRKDGKGTLSCGCYRKEVEKELGLKLGEKYGKAGPKYELDLTGAQIGKLTVLRKTDNRFEGDSSWSKNNLWVCFCECGREIEVPASYLKAGNKRVRISCGCLEISHPNYIKGSTKWGSNRNKRNK
jgi:hypothetical protein